VAEFVADARFQLRVGLCQRSNAGIDDDLLAVGKSVRLVGRDVVNRNRAADDGVTVSVMSSPPRRRLTFTGFSPLHLSHLSIHLAVPVTGMSSPLKATISSWSWMPACAAGEPSTSETTVGRAQVRFMASLANERKRRGKLSGVAAKTPICPATRSRQKARLATRMRKATVSTRCSSAK
jgi:hypothetical protein